MHKHRICLVLTILVVTFAGCPKSETPVELPDAVGEHLIRFVQLSDPQIVDPESPSRMVRFSPFSISAWRPQEVYGVHTLDATLRRIKTFSQENSDNLPIDFAVITGDLTDGCQHNELRWFLKTMDGKRIRPDSGDKDGVDRKQDAVENPTLPYQPEGLDPSIPWYTVFGNHDGLASGIFGIQRNTNDPTEWEARVPRPVAALMGLHRQFPRANAMTPTSDFSPAIITAAVEPMDIDTLRLSLLQLRAGNVVPDVRRRFSSRSAFIRAHFKTDTLPQGHGFTETNKKTGLARYSVRPVKDAPVRLIVLDTVPPNPRPGVPSHYGVMTKEQMDNFLVPELEAAAEANEFVILASHHPSADFDLPYRSETVGTAEFRAYLSSQPHVIAHVCGHTHRNFVQRIEGEHSYYEIETGSIIDYPQEVRVLDVFFNSETNEVRLKSQMISHIDDPTLFSAESYRRAEIHSSYYPSEKAATEAQKELESLGYAGWPERAPSKSERFGREEDRDFELVLTR